MPSDRHRAPGALLATLALAFAGAGPLGAVEGIPRWEQVLNEVLQRAEQERAVKTTHREPTKRGDALPGATDMQPAVEQFVRYFQGPGRPSYQASLDRLRRQRGTLARVLAEEGVPPELIWIGLVESGYNPDARSPKLAVGIWQLIPGTAARFGLRMEGADERRDPEKSTRAAARYLKHLYASFGDWALALAAYNAGEQRVRDAIARTRERDFWKLAGALPRETQAYVPAVLAAQRLGSGPAAIDGWIGNDDATTGPAAVAFAPFSLSR